MSFRSRVLSGVVWSGIQKGGQEVISALVFLLLARLLDPSAFGIVALAGVYIAFTGIFAEQGFAAAIIQRAELEPEHLDTGFWACVSAGALLAILGFCLADPVAGIFKQPDVAPVLRWLSATFVLSGLSRVQEALLRRKLAFKALALRTVVARSVGGAVGIVLALRGAGVWSLVGMQLSGAAAGVLVLWWASDWRPRARFSMRHYRDLFAFGANVIGINLMSFFNRRSADVLIGYFLGPVALGYYTVAFKLLRILTNLVTRTVAQVALPAFSRLQRQPERLTRAFYLATQYTGLVALPILLGMAALAPMLIPLLFGTGWAPSIPVMQILAFVGILQSVYFFNNTVIMAMGKPSWRLGLGCLNAVSSVIAFSIAVHWGITAVALALAIRGYVLSPVPLWVVGKLIHLDARHYLGRFGAPLAASVAMVVAVRGLGAVLGDGVNGSVLVALSVITGALVYAAALRYLAPRLVQDAFALARSLVYAR